MKKSKIGETIKIKEGLYGIVSGSPVTNNFIAGASMQGYFITSLRMKFAEQEGTFIDEEGKIVLSNGFVIQYHEKDAHNHNSSR